MTQRRAAAESQQLRSRRNKSNMEPLTTYNFYINTYYGEMVTEAEFPKYLTRATDEIDFLTYGNIDDTALIIFNEKIQKAVCALIDCIKSIDTAAGGTNTPGTGSIKSLSSGGESVTYEQNAYAKASSDVNYKRQLEQSTIKTYLTGTNLLYAGV